MTKPLGGGSSTARRHSILQRIRRWLIHGARWSLFVLIVTLMRSQHSRYLREQEIQRGAFEVPFSHVARWFPEAKTLSTIDPGHRGRDVLAGDGSRLGSVVQTSPDSDRAIGFSGSTNLLVGLNPSGRIVGIEILSSGDTREHVAQVQRDPRFFAQLIGRSWRELPELSKVDAVSGATLTSLALVEGLSRRAGGVPLSLKFPDAVRAADVEPLFPEAAAATTDPGDPTIVRVEDHGGASLGWCLRTTPAADHIIGYQGPTDALVGFGRDGRVIGVVVLRSFDNDPYVRYVREDDYFGQWFNGKTMSELGGLDLQSAGMEGVSGATMTSQAVAQGIVAAATAAEQARATPAEPSAISRRPFAGRDLGTAAVVVAGFLIGITRLRGYAWLRIVYQLVLIGYLGFVNSDFVSQALLAGWAQHGIPYRTAAGLTLLTAAALLAPAISKHNLYCTHWCPHGAVQQLLKGRLIRRHSPPRWLVPWLRSIPAVLLVGVILTVMLQWPFSLVSIEPFDAYVVRIAGGATLIVAVAGLLASLFIPMAYCRFGCPTGALLGYLRYHHRSEQLTRRDAAACLCLAAAILCFWGT